MITPGVDEEWMAPAAGAHQACPAGAGAGAGSSSRLRANFLVECVQVSMNLTKQLTLEVLKKCGHL